jgi:two-component system chemotaxis response regulator CheY
MRILIVDDNPSSRFIIKDLLESRGHRIVAETEDLAASLEAYRTHRPDLVTLDLSLEGEDGLSVLRAILKLDEHAKILIITGNSQEKIHEEVRAAGAGGLLLKPFLLEELASAVERVQSR